MDAIDKQSNNWSRRILSQDIIVIEANEILIHHIGFDFVKDALDAFDPSKSPPISYYQYGSIINFGKGGNAKQYQNPGWSDPGDGSTWSNGKSANLFITVTKPKSDIIMNASLSPLLVPGKLEKQRVIITVNGRKAGGMDYAK